MNARQATTLLIILLGSEAVAFGQGSAAAPVPDISPGSEDQVDPTLPGGTPSTPTVSTDSYFPAETGNWWIHWNVEDGDAYAERDTITGFTTKNGYSVFTVELRRVDNGAYNGRGYYQSNTSTGLFEVAGEHPTEGNGSFSPPAIRFYSSFNNGQLFTRSGSIVIFGMSGSYSESLRMYHQSGSISVTAGTFSDVIRAESTLTASISGYPQLIIQTTEWYAKGVGMIKASSTARYSGYSQTATLTEELMDYGPKSQTITFNSIPDKVWGDPPFALSASASSGLPVTFNVLSGPASLNGSTVTLSGAGGVTIQATQAGNNNYRSAPEMERSFQVIAPLQDWLENNFTSQERGMPSISGDAADPDGGGLPNLIEYYMALNPHLQDEQGKITMELQGNTLRFNYRHSKSALDAMGMVEWSDDLTNWYTSGVTTSEGSDLGNARMMQASISLPTGKTARFVRLRVER